MRGRPPSANHSAGLLRHHFKLEAPAMSHVQTERASRYNRDQRIVSRLKMSGKCYISIILFISMAFPSAYRRRISGVGLRRRRTGRPGKLARGSTPRIYEVLKLHAKKIVAQLRCRGTIFCTCIRLRTVESRLEIVSRRTLPLRPRLMLRSTVTSLASDLESSTKKPLWTPPHDFPQEK